MKLSDAREAYYTHSGKASDIARSLAFAGLAVVWIFKVGEGSSVQPSLEFMPAIFFLVLALASDLLQYVALTAAWGIFHRVEERKLAKLSTDPEVTAPRWLNWPGIAFFWAKFSLIALAYWVLTAALWRKWFG